MVRHEVWHPSREWARRNPRALISDDVGKRPPIFVSAACFALTSGPALYPNSNPKESLISPPWATRSTA